MAHWLSQGLIILALAVLCHGYDDSQSSSDEFSAEGNLRGGSISSRPTSPEGGRNHTQLDNEENPHTSRGVTSTRQRDGGRWQPRAKNNTLNVSGFTHQKWKETQIWTPKKKGTVMRHGPKTSDTESQVPPHLRKLLYGKVNAEPGEYGLLDVNGTRVVRYRSLDGVVSGPELLTLGVPGPFLIDMEALPDEKDWDNKCYRPSPDEAATFWSKVTRELEVEFPSSAEGFFHRCEHVPEFSSLHRGVLQVTCPSGEAWVESIPAYREGRYNYNKIDNSFTAVVGRKWRLNRKGVQIDPSRYYWVKNEWICVSCFDPSGKEEMNCHIQAVNYRQATQNLTNVEALPPNFSYQQFRDSGLFIEEFLSGTARPQTQRSKLDVNLIMLDSVSHWAFHKQMEGSLAALDFLRENGFSVVEMDRLHTLGPNSWVNQVPLWSGSYCYPYPPDEPLEDYANCGGVMEMNDIHACDDNTLDIPTDTLWKHFQENGYVTANVEGDNCWMNFENADMEFKVAGDIFCNASTVQAWAPKEGFRNLFAKLSYYKNIMEDVWFTGSFHCVAQKPSSAHFIDYQLSFWDRFKDSPKFSTQNWMEGHESTQTRIKMSDDDLRYHLEEIAKREEWQNTITILLSDHGANLDELWYNDWTIGSLENRHPFLFIITPPSVLERYPEIGANLQANKGKVLSWFDLHKTLLHLMNYPDEPKEEQMTPNVVKADSLLREWESQRSCDDAQIWPEWCSCLRQWNDSHM